MTTIDQTLERLQAEREAKEAQEAEHFGNKPRLEALEEALDMIERASELLEELPDFGRMYVASLSMVGAEVSFRLGVHQSRLFEKVMDELPDDDR